MSIDLRTVAHDDQEIMRIWAEHLHASKFWGRDVFDELLAAEFRVCAYVHGQYQPVAFASVTPDGSPDSEGVGELWFDHLFIAECVRGRNIMRILYEKQLEYVATIRDRRAFRVPVSPQVVEFSKRRGWIFSRETPTMPFGVYELPLQRSA